MAPSSSFAMREILQLAVAARITDLTQKVSTETNNTVYDGPFKGMVLPNRTWLQSQVLPKLLGTYEQELQKSVELAIARNPEIVFSIGAGQEYYSVGLARRLPEVNVIAFDSSDGHHALRKAVELNEVENTVTVYSSFRPELLDCWKNKDPFNGLMMMDCEGDELNILTPCRVKKLVNTDVIIECHDFKDYGINIPDTMFDLFAQTHDVRVIREGPRDPAGMELLGKLSSLDRALCMEEGRPEVMSWVVAWSKQRGKV